MQTGASCYYELRPKVKVHLFLSLSKHRAMRTCPLLNQAPSREDVLGEWKFSSTH